MELLWQDGQVVAQRSLRRSQPLLSKYHDDAVLRDDQRQRQQQQHVFMGEDEMASWLHYPLNDANIVVDDDNDFSSHLLYPTPPSSSIHPPESIGFPVLESAVVDSSLTPPAGRSSVGALSVGGGAMAVGLGVSVSNATNREVTTTAYEMALTSSPGGSSSSAEPSRKPPAERRKRKGKVKERDIKWQSEVDNFKHYQYQL